MTRALGAVRAQRQRERVDSKNVATSNQAREGRQRAR